MDIDCGICFAGFVPLSVKLFKRFFKISEVAEKLTLANFVKTGKYQEIHCFSVKENADTCTGNHIYNYIMHENFDIVEKF